MESTWMAIAFVLFIMFLIVCIYHLCYRINVTSITKQLENLIKISDTNAQITVSARQKDIVNMVNKINRVVFDNRTAKVKMKRLNKNFRQSIINISHDLRTPLTTASGYVQMLQEDVTEEERKAYLAIILERQNMVRMLLEQLFEYVRIESGEIVYEKELIDARKIFVDTIAMYYDDFNNKNQEPSIILPENKCMISGDINGVQRIFSNIIFNALLHGKGDYVFEIKESDGYIFSFSNISEPLSNEDLDNMFERFYTKDKSRNKKTTGLGLSIAKEITTRLGGKIEAYYNNERLTISIFFNMNM